MGVASGVATLVIALAMNSGFRTTLQDRLLGVTAHVSISRPGSEALTNYSELAERLGHVPGVKAVAPAIYITVLLSSGGRAHGVVVKGIDPALEAKRNEALQRIVAGSADFAPDPDGFDSIIVGKDARRRFEIAAQRLRHAHQPGGSYDAVRNDSSFPAVPYQRNL